jgi:hypothetical protein
VSQILPSLVNERKSDFRQTGVLSHMNELFFKESGYFESIDYEAYLLHVLECTSSF